MNDHGEENIIIELENAMREESANSIFIMTRHKIIAIYIAVY